MSETTATLVVRKVKPAEHDQAAAVLAACFTESFSGLLSPAALAALSVDRARARVADPAAVTLAAFSGGVMVGIGQVKDDWITLLYLRQSHHGQGIADGLFTRLCEIIWASGHLRARLWCLHNNWRARSFYERYGSLTGLREIMHVGGEPLLHLEYMINCSGRFQDANNENRPPQ